MDELRILANAALFAGVASADISAMLRCLSPRRRHYQAGETILHAGDLALEVGVVLEGSVRVERVDAWAGALSSSALARARPLPRPMPAWRANRCSSTW